MDKASMWGRHQAAWRDSGLSVAAYCRRRGLAYAQWMYWQRRLGRRAFVAVQVEVHGPAAVSRVDVSSSALMLSVMLPNGLEVRLAGAGINDAVTLLRGLSC